MKGNGQNVNVAKCDQIAMFKFGSTVVMVLEAPQNFKFEVKEGETVRYGQTFGSVD